MKTQQDSNFPFFGIYYIHSHSYLKNASYAVTEQRNSVTTPLVNHKFRLKRQFFGGYKQETAKSRIKT